MFYSLLILLVRIIFKNPFFLNITHTQSANKKSIIYNDKPMIDKRKIIDY